MRRRKPPPRIHRESPANIPLVQQMFTDPHVRIAERALDAKWWYSTFFPSSLAGFNPLLGTIFVPRESAIGSWLRANPWGPSRKYNLYDSLVGEVLFAVHDYLHAWSSQAVRALVPAVEYGTAQLTKKNVEDLAFCHILTEACATVGLDYWYLCTLNLNSVCDIGTHQYQHGLTVSFREDQIAEHKRYSPSLNVQEIAFYDFIARFYCTGELYGFKPAALKDSMITRDWLAHELCYGQKQRIYFREWLSFLSGGKVSFSQEELRAPLRVDRRWKSKLIDDLGGLLWEKVKENKPHHGFERIPEDRVWRAPPRDPRSEEPLDFRFINLNVMLTEGTLDLQKTKIRHESFTSFASQWASRHRFENLPKEALRLLTFLIDRKDPVPLPFLFRGMDPLPPSPGEPVDLFLLP